MKIAITADVHLTSYDRHPERYHALESILDQLVEQNIDKLVIAGDLFDASSKSPGEFEELFNREKYRDIDCFIIPGNHDPVLSSGAFSLKNLRYIVEPELLIFDNFPFLFIPYNHDVSIGEVLAQNSSLIPKNKWVLISHGDWLSGGSVTNEYEDGLYMPISNRDIALYSPKMAFLGHIHLPMDSSIVSYPGSPCGLDPTETGIRSFIVFDTLNSKVTRRHIDTDFVFFNEVITIIPLSDEEKYLQTILSAMVENWGLEEAKRKKARVRISVRGYSTNRNQLVKIIQDFFQEYEFADNNQPDVSKVIISTDTMREQIAQSFQNQIHTEGLLLGEDEPSVDEIILSAMNKIYGG